MKHFIQKRCKDYSDSPSSMISSLLEKKRRIINLDRVIVQDANNNETLITDSASVKQATIQHFQNVANSQHHEIADTNEEWLKWKDQYEPLDIIDSSIYYKLMDLPSLSEWRSTLHS